MTRYEQIPLIDDGWTIWIIPKTPLKHKIACCDCGLIHDLEFRVVDDAVHFRARRNERATGQRRRYLGAERDSLQRYADQADENRNVVLRSAALLKIERDAAIAERDRYKVEHRLANEACDAAIAERDAAWEQRSRDVRASLTRLGQVEAERDAAIARAERAEALLAKQEDGLGMLPSDWEDFHSDVCSDRAEKAESAQQQAQTVPLEDWIVLRAPLPPGEKS